MNLTIRDKTRQTLYVLQSLVKKPLNDIINDAIVAGLSKQLLDGEYDLSSTSSEELLKMLDIDFITYRIEL